MCPLIYTNTILTFQKLLVEEISPNLFKYNNIVCYSFILNTQ